MSLVFLSRAHLAHPLEATCTATFHMPSLSLTSFRSVPRILTELSSRKGGSSESSKFSTPAPMPGEGGGVTLVGVPPRTSVSSLSSPKNMQGEEAAAALTGVSDSRSGMSHDNYIWQQQQQQQPCEHGDCDYGGVWEEEEDMVDLEMLNGEEERQGGSRNSLSSVLSQEQMIHLLPEKNASYGFKEREASLSCRYRRQRHKVAGDKWKTIGMGGNRESHADLTQHVRRPSDGSLGEDSLGGRSPPLVMMHVRSSSIGEEDEVDFGRGEEGEGEGRGKGNSISKGNRSSNGGRCERRRSYSGDSGRPPAYCPFKASSQEDKVKPQASPPRQQSQQHQHEEEEHKQHSSARDKSCSSAKVSFRPSSKSPPKNKRSGVSSSSSIAHSSSSSSSSSSSLKKSKNHGEEGESLPSWASHALGALVHEAHTHSQALVGKFVKAVDDMILGATAPAMGLFLTFAHDLPRALNHVHFEKDLRMPMPRRKGEDLRHSLSFMFLHPTSSGRGRKYPTILVRNPYGRLTFFYFFYLFAQRGYNVVVQDVRGRGESTGVFDCIHDHEDSQATLEWITSQPWYSPEHGIGLLGMSYNGFVLYETFKDTAWPIHPAVKAVVPINTTSRLSTMSYRDGPLHLELIIRWSGYLWTLTRDTTSLLALLLSLGHGLTFLGYFGLFDHPRLTRALRHLPVEEITKLVTGVQLNRFQMFLSPPGCDFVKARDASTALRPDLPPAQIHSSWYDIFLIDSFYDFNTLVGVGNKGARIMITSDFHVKRYFHYGALVREALLHFKRYLRREPLAFMDKEEEEERVTVQLIHPKKGLEWVGFKSWPPKATVEVPMRLSADGGCMFGTVMASSSEGGKVGGMVMGGSKSSSSGKEGGKVVAGRRQYTYFPSDPTPSVGGNGIGFLDAGEHSQNQFEAMRGGKDLLVYTSEILMEDMYVIGTPRAELYVRCLSPRAQQADFVVRLCDVSPDGKSKNICDGVRRVPFAELETMEWEEGGRKCGRVMKVSVNVYPTAVRFPKGHRVRIHVAPAGFIRWERNVMAYGYPSFIPVRFEVLHGWGGLEGGRKEGGSVVHLPMVPVESLAPSRLRS